MLQCNSRKLISKGKFWYNFVRRILSYLILYPHINKILDKNAETVFAVVSNEKVSKLLVELERPFESKLFDSQLLPFTDILYFPKAEAFQIPRLPRRKR